MKDLNQVALEIVKIIDYDISKDISDDTLEEIVGIIKEVVFDAKLEMYEIMVKELVV